MQRDAQSMHARAGGARGDTATATTLAERRATTAAVARAFASPIPARARVHAIKAVVALMLARASCRALVQVAQHAHVNGDAGAFVETAADEARKFVWSGGTRHLVRTMTRATGVGASQGVDFCDGDAYPPVRGGAVLSWSCSWRRTPRWLGVQFASRTCARRPPELSWTQSRTSRIVPWTEVMWPCFPRVAFRGKARTRAQRRRASCDRVARLLWDMWGAGRWQRAYVLGVYVVTAQHVDRARSSWHAEGG